MDVEVRIDKTVKTPKVIIVAGEMDGEVAQLVRLLSSSTDGITGSRGGTFQILRPEEIIRIYTSGRQVVAATLQGEFILRLRLYEAEEKLASRRFVRISNSEIVNLHHVKCFDVSKAGVVCVVLEDGTTTFVSRRFIPAVRKLLGM